MKFKFLIFCSYFFLCQFVISQEIPSRKVLNTSQISKYLKEDVEKDLSENGKISKEKLAKYFREKFSERYFYNWKTFNTRFEDYKKLYKEKEGSHTERALDHLSKFSDSTQWILPFNYLNGEPVNAYALRHLARQHKMVDISFYYNYQNKDSKFLNYFTDQLKSLNAALSVDEFEKIEDGNGVYEAFRSGYRVLNWLQIHNMFLGEETYSDEDQLTTIATLLQHAAYLYERNPEFHAGNHQTRGLSALAMISIVLRDFKGTDVWYTHSMKLLEEHLSKEINDDGFQFERSVHYHISDIENYYFVYQLAKTSGIAVNTFWEEKLKSLFTTLTKISFPDKSAPVLQDDTDNPWAEKNDISGALTLGYLLFEDPEMGYFANNKVQAKMYWYLNENQLQLLNSINKEKPSFKSVSFPTTGYYISRNDAPDAENMMIISAGLDADKPDHQHGDMLGIQAMANGKVVLPNYQVRYSLSDLELFKNSMVKNVALVDNELQGKRYTSNQGGSGFGKFQTLPNPKVITWNTDKNLDLFVGSHDGFENVGVAYSRQVINIKNDFWIVKDNFSSEKEHNYKQVWQGHYTLENQPNLLRATFDDATGFDIFQLNKIDEVTNSGTRGKHWSVVSKNKVNEFSFITVLYPYSGYDNRINELEEVPDLKGWKLNDSNWNLEGENVVSLSKENQLLVYSINKLNIGGFSIETFNIADLYISIIENKITIQNIGDKETNLKINGVIEVIMDGENTTSNIKLTPGKILECVLE
ncbi:heparinase II/III family protein [Lutibacter flavus]|uniref:Heparinase II/III-like protein n=1 Tax=Lutibacter flavus TaxID=691689 RepID=A0A238VFI2_9FLAO|nr:heparinase II/III family protein [Lutibacter flavus]SNR32924.1 Heparinase II/III-like protein [Lutibacter flavus]